jgi:hypothetical protein
MSARQPLLRLLHSAAPRAASAALAGAIAVAALAPARASAQDTPVGMRPYRFTVEGLLAQSYLDDALVGSGKQSFGGYGVRVLFNRSTPAATLRSFAERASVGAFLVRTNAQGTGDLATTHAGVQADVSLLPRPAFRGTLDPFVSLGLGGFRTAGRGFSNTDLAVTPAIGTRLSIIQGFGLRGDLRAPVVFGERPRSTGWPRAGSS